MYFQEKYVVYGKSKNEIIDELKSKGKYEEWIRIGGNFGLTSNTLNAKFFLIRPYKYYDVDGNIVDVSMVQSDYRPDVNNIAVFKQFIIRDPTHVDQSTYRICDISETLSTTGLATCTGLIMIIGNKKFLTHLDASTNILPIVKDINKTLSEYNSIPNNITNIKIYAGSLDHSLSIIKAKDICTLVGIEESKIEILQACMFDRVSI
jgi:hypothetical protein